MTKQERIELCAKTAREAQIRDDVCSRSTMIGLKAGFDWIPEDFVRASASLCGGAGASSGTCGTYTAGLLAVGLKYNSIPEEEAKDPAVWAKGEEMFKKLRDRFREELGTTMCPEFQQKVFGRTFKFYDPADCEVYGSITDHAEKCADVVEQATRVIATLLLEDEDE